MVFEKINNAWQTLARLRKIRVNTQISTMVKKKERERDIKPDVTKVKTIIRDCYEQLVTIKLDNLKWTDKLLETYNLLGLSHKETESLNRPVNSKKIKSNIENLSVKK